MRHDKKAEKLYKKEEGEVTHPNILERMEFGILEVVEAEVEARNRKRREETTDETKMAIPKVKRANRQSDQVTKSRHKNGLDVLVRVLCVTPD